MKENFKYALMQRDENGTEGVIAQSNDREALEASITPDVADHWFVRENALVR